MGTFAPLQDDHEDAPGDEPQHAEQLRQSQAGERRRAPDEVDLVGMIAAKVLRDEADDRVVDDIEGEDLAVELLFLQDEEEDAEVDEIEDGLVELDGMEGGVQTDPGQLAGVLVPEDDGPGRGALAAVAAAGAETADPAEAVAQGQGRRDEIGGRPGRDLLAVEIIQREDDAERQPALEDASRPGQ